MSVICPCCAKPLAECPCEGCSESIKNPAVRERLYQKNPFKFNLMDRVKIKELEMLEGTVRQCLLVYTGIQYEVRYFDKGDAKTAWFYEEELS